MTSQLKMANFRDEFTGSEQFYIMHFVSQQYTLTFLVGQTRAEFTVDITDDNVIEAMESFQLLLSIPDSLISKGVQVGPNSAATVTIMDNDGELYL